MRTITSLGSFAVKNDGSEDFKTYVLEPLNEESETLLFNGLKLYGIKDNIPFGCDFLSEDTTPILTVSQVKEFLSGTGEDLVASVPNDSSPVVSHPSASGNPVEQKSEASKMMEDSRKTMDLFFRDKFHAVEYSGYWHIQTEPHYGGADILNAEDVGEETAENNAKLIAKLLNEAEPIKKEMERMKAEIEELKDHIMNLNPQWKF